MKQAEGIVPFDDIEPVLSIQHRKCKRALNLFSHVTQAVKAEGFLLLNQLDCNIAVRLNLCPGQVQRTSEPVVIVQDSVVGQCKFVLPRSSQKGVIIVLQDFCRIARKNWVVRQSKDQSIGRSCPRKV